VSLVPLSPAGRRGMVFRSPAANDWYVLTSLVIMSRPLIVVDRMRDTRPHQRVGDPDGVPWEHAPCARDIFQYAQDGSEDIRRLSCLSVKLAPPLLP
jgi:hypothetical protein